MVAISEGTPSKICSSRPAELTKLAEPRCHLVSTGDGLVHQTFLPGCPGHSGDFHPDAGPERAAAGAALLPVRLQPARHTMTADLDPAAPRPTGDCRAGSPVPCAGAGSRRIAPRCRVACSCGNYPDRGLHQKNLLPIRGSSLAGGEARYIPHRLSIPEHLCCFPGPCRVE